MNHEFQPHEGASAARIGNGGWGWKRTTKKNLPISRETSFYDSVVTSETFSRVET